VFSDKMIMKMFRLLQLLDGLFENKTLKLTLVAISFVLEEIGST
jgi:hypothetical protein